MTEMLSVSPTTAGKLLDRMAQLGIVEEITGGQRNRRYRNTPYLALFEEADSRALPGSTPVQTTAIEAVP